MKNKTTSVQNKVPNRNFCLENANLSFSGCGFNGIYHVGVASCFMEYCPQVCLNKVSGASAGAIAATAFACQLPLGESTSEVLKVATEARSRALGPMHPRFDVNKIIRDALEKVLPEDAHIKVNGRLHISVTRVHDGKNVILDVFDSKEDLIQAVICSCFIPFWSGVFPPKFHGVAYIDGGFTQNIVVLDENTITISPFTGETDICPLDPYDPVIQVSVVNQSFALTPANIYRLTSALYPPHPEVMAQLCKMGFDDALRFLQRNKVISCMRCIAIQSSFAVAETEDVIEDPESRAGPHDYDGCRDCQSRREAAVIASLPDPVARAIQDMCDQVDKGVYNWLLKHRPVKVLSFVMLPYILPFDVAIVILIKLWRQVPLLKSHIKGTVKNLSNCIMQSSEHMYSAMFSCTLSVLEYSYHADDVNSDAVNWADSCAPVDGKKLYRSNTFAAATRQRKIGTIRQPMQRKSYAGNEQFIQKPDRKISCIETMKPPERVISSVNLGFNMTLGNSQSPRSSNRSLNSSFKNLLCESSIDVSNDYPPDPIETLKHLTVTDGTGCDKSEISALSLANRALSLNDQEDVFDNSIHSTILAAAKNRNALMTFYYMDEQNRVKMTEIFNIPPTSQASCQQE